MEFIKEAKSQGQVQSQNEVPTLTIIDDVQYDNPYTQWFLTVDIKDIWEQYKSKSITFEDFTKQYNQRLLQQQTELQKISERCWNDLVEITNQVNEYNEEKSSRYFSRIYDWGDEHGIKIDTGGSQSQDSQTQTQNNEGQ